MSEPSASEGDKPPERIYLQYYGNEEPSEGPAMEVSWCAEKIYEHDVAYVRLESIAELLEARAAQFSRPSVAAYELERMAREIRDGAHRGE